MAVVSANAHGPGSIKSFPSFCSQKEAFPSACAGNPALEAKQWKGPVPLPRHGPISKNFCAAFFKSGRFLPFYSAAAENWFAARSVSTI
jgi:hypothetical protein